MGQGNSTPNALSERGEYDEASSKLFLSHLAETGRYYVLEKPGGGTVHVLGVVPASEHSAQETSHLIRAIRPKQVYVDTATYDVEEIREAMKREKVVPWRPQSQPPLWEFDFNLGALSFVLNQERTLREVWRLVGIDLTASWRSALTNAEVVGADVVSFPVKRGVAYQDPDMAMFRGCGVIPGAAGNNYAASDTIGYLMTLGPTQTSLVDKVIRIPPAGYVTTLQMATWKEEVRNLLESKTRELRVSDADVEAIMDKEAVQLQKDLDSEDAAVKLAATTRVQQLAMHQQLLGPQSEIAAWQMRSGEGDTVGIVDIGRAGSIFRAWEHARPPEEFLRERNWPGWMMQVGAPSLVGSAGLYGYYRFTRRFRRTGIAAGVLTAALSVMGVLHFREQPSSQYGAHLWAALANPVPPIGANLGLGAAKGPRK